MTLISKVKRSVPLSSSKVKWKASNVVIEDIIFILKLLKVMGIKVKLPVIVGIGNRGYLHGEERDNVFTN